MKKWYFSKGGEVSGPLDLLSAKKFIENKSDYYGWHPSFRTWKPVTMIGEFSEVVKAAPLPSQVPKELINEFNQKKRGLNEKLSQILEGLKETHTIKTKLKKKINIYKELTENLSDDFKSAIESVENQYISFTKRIAKLEEAAEIARGEITEVVKAFEERVANKEANSPQASFNQNEQLHEDQDAPNVKVRKYSTSTESDNAVANDKAQEEVSSTKTEKSDGVKSPRRIVVDTKAPQIIKADTSTEQSPKTKESKPTPRVTKISTSADDAPLSKDKPKINEDNKGLLQTPPPVSVAKITSLSEEEPEQKDSFTGVKGLFKSVFKTSSPAPKFSTQLKQSVMKDVQPEVVSQNSNDDGNVVELKSAQAEEEKEVVDDFIDEDEAEKNRRLRRRRRRR
ncbi:hypothetical protein [Thalassotalea ganghwensis]